MRRFEYKIERIEATNGQSRLNELGSDGWELLKLDQLPSGNHIPGDWVCVFKREFPPFRVFPP